MIIHRVVSDIVGEEVLVVVVPTFFSLKKETITDINDSSLATFDSSLRNLKSPSSFNKEGLCIFLVEC